MSKFMRLSVSAVACVLIGACGGGGGGNAPQAPPTVGTPPPPPPPVVAGPTRAELVDASRFASRATFGMPYAAIETIAEQTPEAWLEAQFMRSVARHVDVVTNLVERRDAGEFEDYEKDRELLFQFRRFAWWDQTMGGLDFVRQRAAFALSQILVVSDNTDQLVVNPFALTSYYDLLLEHAFGNYRDLLYAVSRHPAMGVYLSHLNNRKAIPERNIFPDENFAREIMQLFTIGLHELDIDGTQKLDANGDPVPTYSQDEIREFAKVFTGFSFGGDDANFGMDYGPFRIPMRMFEDYHDRTEKRLLNGTLLPAGLSGLEDFDRAIDNLFEHPNVGPFIGRQLIQRLVTSNPSPAYVERVARAFNGDSTGIRGDMKAVWRAILFDPEVATRSVDDSFGKLREPVMRYLAIARQFGATSPDNTFYASGYMLNFFVRQHPLSSPTVFNFFLPDYAPPGPIANAGLVAPEFQITNTTTIVGGANVAHIAAFSEDGFFDIPDPFPKATLRLDDYLEVAGDVEELVDRLDIVMMYGRMSDATRTALTETLATFNDAEQRVRHGIFLVAISPEYVVED